MIWPFGFFHHIKLCASAVARIWVKLQRGLMKRSIQIPFEIKPGLKDKI